MSFLSILSLTSVPGLAVFLPQDEPQPTQERVHTPAEVVIGEAKEKRETETALQDVTDGGEVPILAVQPGEQDDSVPLPLPATVLSGPDGDSIGAQPAGDPFFLGFAGGSHYPPEGELVDPKLMQPFDAGDARPGDFTYAMVMFSKRMTDERLRELEGLGARLLGFHPHYTIKVAVDSDAISAISTLDFVRWVGPPQRWQKLSPNAGLLTEGAGADELLPFHVSVWESDMNERSVSTPIGRIDLVEPGGVQYTPDTEEDQRARIWQSNGWMQAALEQRGIKVERYVPSIETFEVLVTEAQLHVLTGLDFVLFVDPVLAPTFASAPHDESTAMIASDYIRSSYDGGTNEVAVVGIIDSGVENSHTDLSMWGVGWSCSGADPWDDDVENGGKGHGTHCTGTILGRGVTEADHLGNAPGLALYGADGRYFNFRGFSPGSCLNAGVDIATNTFDGGYTDGGGVTTPKPHVVSNSWGYTQGADPIGCETNCRILDDAVYDNDQVYVFAAGNEGGGGAATLRIEASSKNVITVGSVVDYISVSVGDPGNLWSSSSRGPCGDNRWKPNVVAPGRQIRSAIANDLNGYDSYSGTSMATPHVTALVATLADHYSWTRYAPARVTSLLMASAITKNNQTIISETDSHLDTYGAGRVNALKAHWAHGDYTYTNWGFSLSGGWTFADFDVPAGTTRIVAVMTGIEEACGAGASQALINDYDFWLDRDPIDPSGNTGEYFAHQSQVDNSELRIIDNPQVGPWRWKVWPDSVTNDTVKFGVTIYFVKGDTTPDATMTLGVDDTCVQPGELVHATATIDNDEYIASAVVLDRSGSTSTLVSSSTTLYDGVVTDLLDSEMDGRDILLGDITYVNDRSGTWGLTYASEGVKTISVNARSDNMIDKSGSIQVTVDGTDPSLVSNLQSPSHTENQWSNDPTIQWTWSAATDNLAGLQGYGIFETFGCGAPANILDLGPVTTYTSAAYPSSNSGRYFTIRSVDNCDNWDAEFECAGPYFIDVDLPGAPAITASTHAQGSTSCDTEVTIDWDPAFDAHSGIAGYSVLWNHTPNACPNATVETAGLQWVQDLTVGTWYFHVRSLDIAGNWTACADVTHFGPITITDTGCILFSDDFESGDLDTGGWVRKSKKTDVHRRAAETGDWGARIRKSRWIEKSLDTTGFEDIVVRYSRRTRKYDGGEKLTVQWTTGNGGPWQILEQTKDTAWDTVKFELPASANDNSNVRIRFSTNADEGKEHTDLDNVSVIGNKL